MFFVNGTRGNGLVADEMDYQAPQKEYGSPAVNARLDFRRWHWAQGYCILSYGRKREDPWEGKLMTTY